VIKLEITKLSEKEPKGNIHNVDARLIYNKPYAQSIIISLKPGESLKPHKTPVDVFFYVLEGKGIVLIGEEKQEVSKDCIIHSPGKINHSWSNESESLLRILVAKTPNPSCNH
jgi:quercetin dioxygenase-like cupin family protein